MNALQKSAVILGLLGTLLFPAEGFAQKVPWIPRGVAQSIVKPFLHHPLPALERGAFKETALQADIRLSVARLDHAVCLDLPPNKRPHSTAFLFKIIYKGKPEIWAASAGHVAQPGEKLLLTFYNGKKEIPVKGELVQQGPALLSDASLIRLNTPLPADLKPFTLNTQPIDPQAPLTTWGYASNKLYHLENLAFEKDNTRFIRTDFPPTQRRRVGLCGGPLLNAQNRVLGIHCGSTPEDKAYASHVGILPFLVQAYHEGDSLIPLIIHHQVFGEIHIEQRIYYIQCLAENGTLLNSYNVYSQLHQSDVVNLLKDPEVRYIHFLLGPRYENKIEEVLVYDTHTHDYYTKPFKPGTKILP